MKRRSTVLFKFILFTSFSVWGYRNYAQEPVHHLEAGTCLEAQNFKKQKDSIPSNNVRLGESYVSIPVNGNSWYITNSGKKVVTNATATPLVKDTLRTFFSIRQNCNVSIAMVVKSHREAATIDAIFGQIKKRIHVKPSSFDTIVIDTVQIKKQGYNYLDLINTSNSEGIQILTVMIKGDFIKSKINFAKDEFYWSERGPSVHLMYALDANIDSVKWFYNELMVPKGNDVIGSYFMTIGFNEGYFGIQVNSETERRILFSVWSPHQTDNPQDIPENQRIKLLKKGEAVTAGNFGGEGSGGQSYMNYAWKAGIIYKFLLKGEPTTNNSTDYTAYFYCPEEHKWLLIASFNRPQTSTYLTGFYSFLENFYPEQGRYVRMGIYSNQWVCDKNGKWFEVNKAILSADNTAHKGYRLDFAGGVINDQFFMKNCGFFDGTDAIGSQFIRPIGNKKPNIDFQRLP